MAQFGRLIREKRWEDAAAFVSQRFGVACKANDIRRAVERFLQGAGMDRQGSWSNSDCDDLWMIWVRNRLDEWGLFQPGHRGAPTIEFYVELHVGFLCLLETPQELALLRREKFKAESQVARSKICREDGKTKQPVDGTAAKVVS